MLEGNCETEVTEARRAVLAQLQKALLGVARRGKKEWVSWSPRPVDCNLNHSKSHLDPENKTLGATKLIWHQNEDNTAYILFYLYIMYTKTIVCCIIKLMNCYKANRILKFNFWPTMCIKNNECQIKHSVSPSAVKK